MLYSHFLIDTAPVYTSKLGWLAKNPNDDFIPWLWMQVCINKGKSTW